MRIHLILILLFSHLAFSQTHNFKVENTQLIYEKIFQESRTISELTASVSIIPGETTYQDSTKIIYQFKDVIVPFQKYGGKVGSSPFFIINPISGTLTIETKGNRFRILATNLTYTDKALSMVTGVQEASKLIEKDVVDRSKGAIKNQKSILAGLSYLDQYFSELVTVKRDDEW